MQDLGLNVCTKTNKICRKNYLLHESCRRSESDPAWYSPESMAQVAALLAANPSSKFKFIAGDTGKGKPLQELGEG